MSEVMLQSDEVQVIKGRGLWNPIRLVVTKNEWYFFDFGIAPWMIIVAQQFGLLGMAFFGYIKSKKKKAALASFEGKTPEEILSLSPKHIKVPLSEVTEYEVKDGGLRNLGQKSIVFTANGQKYHVMIDKDHFDTARSQFEQQVSPDKKKK